MFKKILIANRGEIACRVAATARRLGIKTVAVYSSADAHSRHVSVCDEAVYIGEASAKESYLRDEKIIDVALAYGAQAIHPGYGFLSENAQFALACAQKGIAFIGPPASAIDAMGSKSAAKTLMEKAGVPLVPGYHGENQDADFLLNEANRIGYPVLLKASAGGGGKGMRVVDRADDFKEALASCKREAINSFGDDKVLVEKYLQKPRHIEIQVFADQTGETVYLFERDCSVQRRHQKVLEEAPAPGMTPERRAAMGEAAVAAAKAVGYVGAGTVEFIANQDGSFYFMEMNTRLQVEHPVTEMITGTDLVEWQLRVAAGEPLPLKQDQLRIHGHALEARIYAENPEKGFLPSIGHIAHMRTPVAAEFTHIQNATGVRIDSGIRAGDDISPYYDPMIAKLIVWGEDRSQALSRMQQALQAYQIAGLHSNLAFLSRLITCPSFAHADLDTGLIARETTQLFPELAAAGIEHQILACVALLGEQHQIGQAATQSPWQVRDGWRMNIPLQRLVSLNDETHHYPILVSYDSASIRDWTLRLGDTDVKVSLESCTQDSQAQDLVLTIQLGQTVTRIRGSAVIRGEAIDVFYQGSHREFLAPDPLAHSGEDEAEGGRLTAPMPGKIVAIHTHAKANVKKGEPLLIMEAMKMEHTISAPHDGIIDEILYGVGDQVSEGAQLLRFQQ